MNIIINSIPENTDYIIIYDNGYNVAYSYSVMSYIIFFKIDHKNNDNNLSKENNNNLKIKQL